MKGISFFILLVVMSCAAPEKKMETFTDLNEAKGPKFRQCYVESDLYQQKRPGKMEVSYVINPSGKVSEAQVTRSDFKDPNLHACVLGLLRGMEYYPPADGKPMQVSYPFNFIPGIKNENI